MKTRSLILILSLLCNLAQAQTPLQQDADFIRQTIREQHPNLGFSADAAAVERALTTIAADAPASLSRDESWQRLAVLNGLFADAHLFIGSPDWRADTAAHLKSGGGLFPFEVEIDGDGQLVIRAALGDATTELAGARIVAINGVAAGAACAQLLLRTHGDTPRFRSHLLAQRWWLYHWKMYGAASRYQLDLAREDRAWQVTVAASTQTPAILLAERDPFGFELRPDGSALLKVDSFDHEFKERFMALTHAAFTQMNERHISTLFIDISSNGGGDDDLWLDGLMPYLATRPYRTGSTYTKKTAGSPAIDGEIQTWRPAQPDNPLRFSGKVVVVIGPATYSSAVLFANVMQDFGFGTLAGEGKAARRAQSGGIRKFILPQSGLALWVPRFVLDPPNGETRRDTLLAPR
ncbi:hypothetical protein GJ699_17395 [Duganella sp. FT80W]|uniref:Tail specific protease domain-containing protein n=1 Tax=Duganella guangzhouensis TaxID=2666084 RepID=A0A6I2L1N9_9BURK|nr:S41 family peptidase [Duganella guangzhouensis]MRW91772.1 hypothetical protein [Duganella guangzhouensis]